MILRDEKIKKISDTVFQEYPVPKDRTRPLEWRRSFNYLTLPIKNLRIIALCRTHETEYIDKSVDQSKPMKLISANISNFVKIEGVVDYENMMDNVYCTVEDDKENEIFKFERPSGEIKIILQGVKPTEENEYLPAGIYPGNTFRMNFEPGEDDLYFDLPLPKEQITSLISALKEDENSTLLIEVSLLSFTYEVDDALNEHYHSRDIVIHDSPHCVVECANVSLNIGKHSVKIDEEIKDDVNEYREVLTLEQQEHQELLQAILVYLMPIKILITAILVLIAVIILFLFLK